MVDGKKIEELFMWMCDGAPPGQDGRTIVDGICRRLIDAGVPVGRMALFIFTIHPTVRGRRLGWSPEKGAEMFSAGYGVFNSDIFFDNPIPEVIGEKKIIRRKLADPNCPDDYIIVGELREEGFTDYIIYPLVFLDGEVHCVSWSCKEPGGFSDEAIEAFARIQLPLARLTEIYMLRLNAASLLSTYVGRGAGEKVMSGQIKRGDGEDISAAILFADLKGFTSLSNTVSNGQVLATLNRFFARLEAAILANKGEILKFMGDGLLAIFPAGDSKAQRKQAAQAAIRSLGEASHTLNEVQAPDVGDTNLALWEAAEGNAVDDIGFRAAVHLGDVHYGNIGGERRLDFTAIGRAVNLTARLLAQAGRVDRDFVCSTQIAELLPRHAANPTTVVAKGFADDVVMYELSV